MLLTLVSRADPASVNIERQLREAADWEEVASFRDTPVLRHGEMLLATIEGMHLEANLVDRELQEATGLDLDAVVVASRHRAESGKASLTVHPIGNWREARYGGRPGAVVPAAPGIMAVLLRGLHGAARRLPHSATFEATHHGPYLETPTCFLEIGTHREHWTDPTLGRVMAELLLALARDPPPVDPPGPVLLAVGGGHYAPRFTDLVRGYDCAVGHILPSYILREGVPADAMREAAARTPGCNGFVLDDRGGLPHRAEVETVLRDVGLLEVPEARLEAR